MLTRPWPERVWQDTGSSTGGGIGAFERAWWPMVSEDPRRIPLGGRSVGCKVGAGVRATLGERANTLSVWTRGDLVGAMEGVGTGIETRGIEVIGRVIMGGDVGVVDGANL